MPAPDTSPPSDLPVLARIVAAHKGAGPGQADLVSGLQTGLTRAIRRAGMPFSALAPRVADVSVKPHANLQDAVEALPEHGLLAAIEDEDGRRGLIALDHPLVDALIEVQTTGHVEEGELPPRKVTRIDEALCRDFLDLLFGAFAQETADQVGRDWPDRLTYGSIVKDRAQLNLLLPEQGYHLLKTSITAAGRKTGDLVMLLPVDAVLARRRAASMDAGAQVPVADWSKDMLAALGAAPMVLETVLMRVVMPLGQVEALGVGDLVPFDHADLGKVQLEDETGHVFAKGALGQLGGKRAFRLRQGQAHAQGAAENPAPSMGPKTADVSSDTAPATPMSAPPMSEARRPNLPSPATPSELPALAGGFNPEAMVGGFDPEASKGGLDLDVPMAGFDPDAPTGEFDPNAPMG